MRAQLPGLDLSVFTIKHACKIEEYFTQNHPQGRPAVSVDESVFGRSLAAYSSISSSASPTIDMADFPFIVSNGPKVPKDPALRTLIRKQAMKDVGIARKKRGRLNVRQEPVRVQEETSGSNTSIDSTAGSSSDSTPATLDACDDTVTSIDDDRTVPADDPLDEETLEWLSEQTWMMPFHGSPITGYEQLRMKYNFDIRDLSILTSFNVGKNTLMAISANPKLLETLFGSQIQSYLQYVPSRYGHKPFLTDVIDCLLAKVHSRLQPPSRSCDTIVMQKYAKALGSLQTAVAGEESSLDPDLLCAIQMLSLHEVLTT